MDSLILQSFIFTIFITIFHNTSDPLVVEAGPAEGTETSYGSSAAPRNLQSKFEDTLVPTLFLLLYSFYREVSLPHGFLNVDFYRVSYGSN